jgi:DnaK suppressor protein
MSDPGDTRARERLRSEQARLHRRLDDARARTSDACPTDLVDLAEATTRREAEAEREVVLQQRLALLDEALERLDAGTYGRCIRCDEPIPAERLELLPTATTCARHADERVIRR